MYGCPRLHAHLAILFTFLLKHQHLPHKFMQSTISPLVKSKGVHIYIFIIFTDVNNYRAIAISNAITKIFETVIIENISSTSDSVSTNLALKEATRLLSVLVF